MVDNETNIPVIFDTADLKADEEIKSNMRFVLGYVFCAYESGVDFNITVYYKRDYAMAWETGTIYTVSKDKKRFFQRLPIGLTVIDAYIKLAGSFDTLTITSLKLFMKPAPVGKFGG